MDVHQDLETLAGQYLTQVMERESNYFDMFLKEELTHLVERVVDQVVERLTERLTAQYTDHGERSMERSTPAITDHEVAVLRRNSWFSRDPTGDHRY